MSESTRVQNQSPNAMALWAGDSAVLSSCRVTRGVVLAGTHPWSRCLLDRYVPRPLLPVANRQLIAYAIDWLRGGRAEAVSICGNSHTGTIRDLLDERSMGSGELEFYADFMPRGPAGCVRDAMRKHLDESVVVVDGTIVPCVDIDDLLRSHVRGGAVMTVVVTDQGGDASRPQYVPAGIYVLEPAALDCIAPKGYQDIKEELIPALYERGLAVQTYVASCSSPRVAGPDSYLSVNDWMVSHGGARDGYAGDTGGALVHHTATVQDGVRIIGPAVIGPHATLERDVLIVGPTSIGARTTIGGGAVVCRSAVWDGCRVGAGARIDRSIVTHSANVPAGGTVRNVVHVGDGMQDGPWVRKRPAA